MTDRVVSRAPVIPRRSAVPCVARYLVYERLASDRRAVRHFSRESFCCVFGGETRGWDLVIPPSRLDASFELVSKCRLHTKYRALSFYLSFVARSSVLLSLLVN